MAKMSAEENLHECLLAIADIGRDYVNGLDCKKRMKAQLEQLEECWGLLADEIVNGEYR